jgi:hypothetical protein
MKSEPEKTVKCSGKECTKKDIEDLLRICREGKP